MRCVLCGKTSNGEYIDVDRRLIIKTSKKDWVLKRFPTALVCLHCLKNKIPEQYQEYQNHLKKKQQEFELKEQLIVDCIKYRIEHDKLISFHNKELLQKIIHEKEV